MLLLPMLEDNFYCNCTFGNRGSIRARDDYEALLPNDDGAMGWWSWDESLLGQGREGT
jgi:hypothetical protein